MSFSPPVSLVILNWNGRELLEECLPSVLAARAAYNGPVEVLVVDNGSSDGSVPFVRERFPDVRVYGLSKNLGFAEGCNAGVAVAEHEHIVLLNNDIQVEPDFLGPLMAHLEEDIVFAVGPKVLYWDRERVHCSAIRGEFRWGNLFQLWALEDGRDTCGQVAPTLYVGGAAMAFRRQKFHALGGFDGLFSPFYWEETDLCYRAWRKGWICLYEPKSVVYHKVSATVLSVLSQQQRKYYLRKHYYLFLWKNLRDRDLWLQHLLALPAWLAWALLRGDAVELRAFHDAVVRWSEVRKRRQRERVAQGLSDKEILKRARWDVVSGSV